MRWARLIVIHGTGGERAHYADAVERAKLASQLLFIECPSRLIEDYKAAADRWARGTPQLVRLPSPGGIHPIAPAPSSGGLLH